MDEAAKKTKQLSNKLNISFRSCSETGKNPSLTLIGTTKVKTSHTNILPQVQAKFSSALSSSKSNWILYIQLQLHLS